MTTLERLKKLVPWALPVGAAVIYAFSLLGGGVGFSREQRAMPKLSAARLDDGRPVSGETLRGKPVILNVWAPSCGPCVRELPALDKLAADYDGRVQVVGLMSFGTAEEARSVAQADALTHLPLLAGGEAFLNALDVESVPTTFFIHPDGTIVARQVGMRGERFFREQADKLLAGTL